MLSALVLGAVLSCSTAITDPPRSPRHTLTPEQRELVLERLNAEIPRDVSGPREEPWRYEFTDVVLHKAIATVTFTVRDIDAGQQYLGQTCVITGEGSVRGMIDDRNGACRVEKQFSLRMKGCLERYESGEAGLAGKPVPISD